MRFFCMIFIRQQAIQTFISTHLEWLITSLSLKTNVFTNRSIVCFLCKYIVHKIIFMDLKETYFANLLRIIILFQITTRIGLHVLMLKKKKKKIKKIFRFLILCGAAALHSPCLKHSVLVPVSWRSPSPLNIQFKHTWTITANNNGAAVLN